MANSNHPAPNIANVPLFHGMDAESLSRIAQAMKLRTFRAGEAIFHREDPGQVMYVIHKGRVRIRITGSDGQEVALAILGPAESFGEMSILDNNPRSADVIAIDNVEVFTLQRDDFIQLIKTWPEISIEMMKILSARMRAANQMVEDLIFLDVFARVAKKLVELSEEHGELEADGATRINIRLTQQELASMIGASRESVNKVMGYFTDKNYISADKHKITIHKIAELRKRIY